MKKYISSYLVLLLIAGCSQQPSSERPLSRLKMVSTFDVALDSKSQLELESEFDKALNPQNLDKWMKHMSSKPHYVGSPWSKQNAEYVANKFEEWGFESDIETFEVKSKKLDSFSFSNKISFIKVDVEGHELAVIRGAENTIKKNKPILLVEIEERHSQKKVSETLDYINSLGYISYFYKNELLKTSSLDNLNLYNNFIFKPK